eukprot:13742650-Alexandrium_andersonii.AAC.1
MHSTIPGVVAAQWVDDVTLKAYGSPRFVGPSVARSVTRFRDSLARDGLVLAEKTTVAASDEHIAGCMRRELLLGAFR